MIKVFGHLAPDTDTTGSAILWSWYLNTHKKQESAPFVLGAIPKETAFVIDRWGIELPKLLESINEKDDVVIVDTNNPQELPPNISEANILAIIDHHKLAGLTTKSPTEVTVKTLASTATVIHDLMGEKVESMPKEMMGLMLSCILSDTLAFRSPTTTSHDKDIAEKLSTKLGVDIQTYANEMFAAKSDLSDFADVDLIHIDSKKFEVGDKNIRVSVIETTTPETILKRKDGLVKAIESILAEEKGVDDVLLFVVDIFKEEAIVLTYNQFTKEIIEASFGVKVSGDTHVLPGIVSRKKQIIPVLKLA